MFYMQKGADGTVHSQKEFPPIEPRDTSYIARHCRKSEEPSKPSKLAGFEKMMIAVSFDQPEGAEVQWPVPKRRRARSWEQRGTI